MRAIASITGLLAMLFIGGTIGGLIFGATEIWGTSLALLGLDAIIGMTAQYFADQKDAQFIRELAMIAKEVEEEEKARQVAQEDWKEEIEEEEEDMILSQDEFWDDRCDLKDDEMQILIDILKKSGLANQMQNMKREGLSERHKEHYERLKSLPESGRLIENVEQDPSGAFLFELCASMPYAPRRTDIYNATAVIALEIADAPALWYVLRPMRGAAIQYAGIFLVRVGENIRLFSVEPSAYSIFLCEFAEGRHINYGDVDIRECKERIAEILRRKEA